MVKPVQPNVNNLAKAAPPAVSAPAPVTTNPARVYAQPPTPVIQPQPTQKYQSPAQLLYKAQNPQAYEHKPAPQQPVMRTSPAETYRQPVNQERSARVESAPARVERPGRTDNSSGNGNGRNDRTR